MKDIDLELVARASIFPLFKDLGTNPLAFSYNL